MCLQIFGQKKKKCYKMFACPCDLIESRFSLIKALPQTIKKGKIPSVFDKARRGCKDDITCSSLLSVDVFTWASQGRFAKVLEHTLHQVSVTSCNTQAWNGAKIMDGEFDGIQQTKQVDHLYKFNHLFSWLWPDLDLSKVISGLHVTLPAGAILSRATFVHKTAPLHCFYYCSDGIVIE